MDARWWHALTYSGSGLYGLVTASASNLIT